MVVERLRHLSINCYCQVDIAIEIVPGGSGIDSSRDCSHADRILFETLIN